MLAAGFTVGEATALLLHKKFYHGYSKTEFAEYANTMIDVGDAVQYALANTRK